MNNKIHNTRKIISPLAAIRIITLIILGGIFVMTLASAIESRHPVVIAVSPNDADQDIPLNTAFRATFSKDMDPSSINTNTILIIQRTTPQSGRERSTQLLGTIKYNSATRTMTFTPEELLRPNQQFGNVYTSIITTGVTDKEGNALEQQYVWSFTTGLDKYNTGSTTTQQDTTASIVNPQQTDPSPKNPLANKQPIEQTPTIQTANNSLWNTPLAIGIYIFLILIALYAAYTIITHKDEKKTPQTRHTSTFGDIHPVSDIEGIGPTFTKQLNKIGINNTKQLWEANTNTIAKTLHLGVKTVQNWQQMAELMAINGIGPQYAELLERSGVRSVKTLAEANPKTLLQQVKQKEASLKVNIQGNTTGQTIVKSWIDAANDHQKQREKIKT